MLIYTLNYLITLLSRQISQLGATLVFRAELAYEVSTTCHQQPTAGHFQ